jgi:hypothetical protein
MQDKCPCRLRWLLEVLQRELRIPNFAAKARGVQSMTFVQSDDEAP